MLLPALAGLLVLALGTGVGYWYISAVSDGETAVDKDAVVADLDDVAAADESESASEEADVESEEEGPVETPSSSRDEPEPAADRWIQFGPGCGASVPADDIEPRPWWYYDGGDCLSAPLDGDQTNWVVILDSLNGDDFGLDDALERADGWRHRGVGDPLILWTDFYASLNPNLWAIVDGPYPTEADAASACSGLPGICYPREVSSDPDARYCDAADGCVGERGR